MPHESLYGKQVNAILVQVGAESMAERMAGKPTFPAEPAFVGMDMSGQEKSVNGPVHSVSEKDSPLAFHMQTSIS